MIDLTVIPGGRLVCQGTGVPVNGLNVIGIPYVDNGIAEDEITNENLVVEVVVDPAGSSVTEARAASPFLSADKRQIRLDVVQGGSDPIGIRCTLLHSMIR